MASARAAFDQVESLPLSGAHGVQIHINRGLMEVASGEYEAALSAFSSALSLDPSNAVAANNVAVCHLFRERLAQAVSCLEGFVKANPSAHLQQAVASNLAALYQMVEVSTPSSIPTREQEGQG